MLKRIRYSSSLSVGLQLMMIVVTTTVIGLSMFVLMPDSFKSKSCGDCEGGYIIVAKNLIEGKGLVDKNGVISIARPPGNVLIVVGLLYVQRWLDMSR